MTSTILMPKSNFGTVFKNLTKRNISTIIFVLVANILLAVAAVSATVSAYSDYLADFLVNKNFEKVDLNMETMAVIGIACAICGLMSLSIAPKMFREIYSKRACDFYFSAPVKRETYFSASYLLGLILNVVAMVIPVAIYVIILKSINSQVFIFDDKLIAKVVVAVVLALLSIYSAFIMCAVTAGKKFQYVLLSLICLFCPAIALSGIDSKINSIWGFYNENIAYGFISPPINAINAVFSYDTKYYKYLYIISVVEIIGMLITGYLVFKNRKAEVAEVSLTGKITPYFLLGLFVLSGFMFTDTVSNNLVTVIVGIIFAVISGLLFSKIFYRKWFTKITAITTGAVCAACVIFVCSIYLPSYDKYVKYIPEVDEIESVDLIDVYGINENELVRRMMFIGSYNSDDMYVQNQTMTITTQQGIEDAINIHRNTVSDEAIADAKKFSVGLNDLLFGYNSYFPTYEYTITYNLKDGSDVKRTYSVGASYVKDSLIQLFRNKEAVLQSYYAFNNSDDILFMNYEKYAVITEIYEDDVYYNYETSDQFTLTDQQAKEFLDVYADSTINLDDDNLKTVVSSMYESILSTLSISDDYIEPSYGVEIFYIDPSATESQRKVLKEMTTQEILTLYQSDIYSENFSDEEIDLYNVINFSHVNVFDFQQEAVSYLENEGK